MAKITVSDVNKAYGENPVLSDIGFSVEQGELLSVVGPSGCGKTTLLHILSGIERPDSGTVDVAGRAGLVFQQPRLLPWMTVEKNIRIQEYVSDCTVADSAVEDILDMIQLQKARALFPNQLSGGMAQRVSFARALVTDPDVILLDEPFGSLDYITKKNLKQRFQDIIREENLTTIYVTHNIEDAVELGDSLIVLDTDPATIVERWDSIDAVEPQEVEEVLEQSYLPS